MAMVMATWLTTMMIGRYGKQRIPILDILIEHCMLATIVVVSLVTMMNNELLLYLWHSKDRLGILKVVLARLNQAQTGTLESVAENKVVSTH